MSKASRSVSTTEPPRISIDPPSALSIKQRSRLVRFLYRLPGFSYIRRIFLLDVEILELDYYDESQELAFLKKKSAADLFYAINLAKMPVVRTAPSTYFHDGKKKIDDVGFYEPTELSQASFITSIPQPRGVRKNSIHFKRESFLSYLQNAGIYMEEDIVQGQNKILHFIKLSVSWHMMTRFADALQLRVPLEIQPEITRNWSAVILQQFGIKNTIFTQYIPEEPLNFYTAPFKRAKLKSYLWSDQKDTFFSATQKIHVVNEILQLCQYGKMRKTEVGIERLLEQKAFIAAFPLHDGDWKFKNENINNMRYILYEHWARWGRWYKYQPLNHIRAYFGEKIAYYFAFLGFYTSWLILYALFGLIIFVIQTWQMFNNEIVNDVCSSDKNYTMCPRCFKCEIWHLSDLCPYFSAAGIFDSIPMVVFSFFSCLWANTFLVNWKRNSALLAYQWSCNQVIWEEQRPRASYVIKAPFLRLNPVTGRTEPHFPHTQKNYRIIITSLSIFVMISIVIASMGLSITYRSILAYHGNYRGGRNFRRGLSVVSNVGSALIQLFLILIIGHYYTKIAKAMTEWEMHRTETEFENNLIFKLFIFQFVNFFSPLFYIAFVKSKFISNPDIKSMSIFGLPTISEDYCEGNSCFLELTIQLGTFLISKQGIWQILQKIKERLQKPKAGLYEESELQWEKDYALEEPEGLLQNYLEIVLQFSFITVFVTAFPLAPLFALIKNCYEIRRYAQNLICKSRRPVPQQAKSIEVWFDILRIIAILSVVSNGFIIAFTSDLIPNLKIDLRNKFQVKQYINETYPIFYKKNIGECRTQFSTKETYTQRYLFLIIYEHITLGITLFLQSFVPSIPKTLQLRLKREQFVSRQTLAETAATLQMSNNTSSKSNIKRRKKKLWNEWEPKRVMGSPSKTSFKASKGSKGSRGFSHGIPRSKEALTGERSKSRDTRGSRGSKHEIPRSKEALTDERSMSRDTRASRGSKQEILRNKKVESLNPL